MLVGSGRSYLGLLVATFVVIALRCCWRIINQNSVAMSDPHGGQEFSQEVVVS